MSLIRGQFFSDQEKGYGAYIERSMFDNVWNKTLEYEKQIGKSLDEGFLREEYIGLFHHLHPTKIATFTNMKMCLVYYVRYLVNCGCLSEENLQVLNGIMMLDVDIKDCERVYFQKDLAQLRSFIEDTIQVATPPDGYYDDAVYDAPACILYLAWFGFTMQEICDLKKSDVLQNGVMRSETKIEMPKYVVNIMMRYRDSQGYTQQARGSVFHRYLYSDYLVRTPMVDHANDMTIKSMLSRFNRIMDKQYALSYQRVRDSGIFFRAYALEVKMLHDGESFDWRNKSFISMIFEVPIEKLTQSQLSRIKSNYARYKQLFSSNG